MTAAKILRVVLLVAALGVLASIVLRDRDQYTVSVPLDNAYGLRDGSSVRVGGVDAGHVSLKLDDDDRVIATMKLDDPVGKDATVSIVAANFLGAKRLVLQRGHVEDDPAPDGYRLSGDKVTVPTDLDQVLAVFDAPTRQRAQILLNEAGRAVMGRTVDIRTLLAEFPAGITDAGDVVKSLTTDNATMSALIRRSDRFVRTAVEQRKRLDRLIDGVGQTAVTVTARRNELRATLAKAPGTLRQLRSFTNSLVATTEQLQPAARELTRSAGPLSGTLAEIDPLRRSATPTLRAATDVSPDLVRLATGATPVVRKARPTLRSLGDLGEALPPLTNALDGSTANLVAILENWSQAIQFRDGLSHVFRGEATFSPDTPLGVAQALKPQPTAQRQKKRVPAKGSRPQVQAASPAAPGTGSSKSAPAGKKTPDRVLDDLLGGLLGKNDGKNPIPKVLDSIGDGSLLGGGPPKTDPAKGGSGRDGASKLLDFLLGP